MPKFRLSDLPRRPHCSVFSATGDLHHQGGY